MASKMLSLGERMSREKETLPGIVLTLPGERESMPVEARAEYLDATSCECEIIRAAARRGSPRAEKGVVPV